MKSRFLSVRLSLARWLIGNYAFGANLKFHGPIHLVGAGPCSLYNCHAGTGSRDVGGDGIAHYGHTVSIQRAGMKNELRALHQEMCKAAGKDPLNDEEFEAFYENLRNAPPYIINPNPGGREGGA